VRVGAHLRSGLRTVIPLARETGAEVVQVFISNPRAWSGPRLDTAQAFGAEWREAAIGPLFVHAPYLVNMGRDEAVAKLRSLGLLVDVAIVPGHGGSRVVFQEPATGTTVHAADLVHIYVA
jgi:deoxyribonuclease IV